MMDWVLMLVFASALLFFMIWPATVITRWLAARFPFWQRWRNHTAVILTIALAMGAGSLLRWL